MRGITFLIVAILLGLGSAQAQTVSSAQLAPLGYCQLSSLSGATKLTSCTNGIPTTASVIVVAAETQAVRWRDDGTAPTASVGMPIATGSALVYQGDLTTIQFIEETASAKIDVSFYKYR